jgi:hypothetical protein
MIALLVTAASMLLVSQPRTRPAALVLDLTGTGQIRPAEGSPKRAEVGDLLYPGERLAVPADGSATLAILGVGAQERIKSGSEATVGSQGCTPPQSVAQRKEQRKAVADALKGLRPAPDDVRKAGLGFRGSEDLPEEPPIVKPLYGEVVASDRPTLAWKPAEGAPGYRVKLLSSAGRELWRAETKEPRLAYPEGKEALQGGYVYRWEVSDAEGRPVATSTFSVATESQRKRLAELPAPEAGEDRAELLAAALAYTKLGAHAEALATYERLARLVPKEPAYQEALAGLYRRAGRPEEAWAASERAARKARGVGGRAANRRSWDRVGVNRHGGVDLRGERP